MANNKDLESKGAGSSHPFRWVLSLSAHSPRLVFCFFPRCETKCRNGTYGENCAFVCNDCFNGECHFESGRCLCQAGFHGLS